MDLLAVVARELLRERDVVEVAVVRAGVERDGVQLPGDGVDGDCVDGRRKEAAVDASQAESYGAFSRGGRASAPARVEAQLVLGAGEPGDVGGIPLDERDLAPAVVHHPHRQQLLVRGHEVRQHRADEHALLAPSGVSLDCGGRDDEGARLRRLREVRDVAVAWSSGSLLKCEDEGLLLWLLDSLIGGRTCLVGAVAIVVVGGAVPAAVVVTSAGPTSSAGSSSVVAALLVSSALSAATLLSAEGVVEGTTSLSSSARSLTAGTPRGLSEASGCRSASLLLLSAARGRELMKQGDVLAPAAVD